MIRTKVQMRFADMDALRHVNNVSLQHYYDLGKSEYFSQVLHLTSIWDGAGFIQVNTNTSYLAQVRLTDDIWVETCVSKLGGKSFTFSQRIVDNTTHEVKSESQSVIVCFDMEKQVSIDMPEEWRSKMSSFEGII